MRSKTHALQHSAANLMPAILCLFLLASCSNSSNQNLSLKSQQYFVQGEQLYIKHCSNCHQKNGTGLGLLYPPLDKSDYMDKNFENVVCLIRNGIKGELTVNGKKYNKEMPGAPTLTDLEVTEVLTYIYNNWEHRKDSIELSTISRVLSTCPQP
jgi:cytochrome c551